MVYNNCVITHQNSRVIIPYIDSKQSEDFKKYKTLNLGVDLQGRSIYTISSGTISQITSSSVLIVGENKDAYFYSNIEPNEFLEEGDRIESGGYIGETKNSVHFEYLQNMKTSSSLQIGSKVYYRIDPTTILEENILRGKDINIRLQTDPEFAEEKLYYDSHPEVKSPEEELEEMMDSEDDDDMEPDNDGSEDTGYPEGYGMPPSEIQQSPDI